MLIQKTIRFVLRKKLDSVLTAGLPLKAFALERKASKVLPLDGALIAPTIPWLQCGCGASCLQKYQMGFEASVIVKFHVGNPEVKPGGMKMVPVSKPSLRRSHGPLKEDWVTEWLPGLQERNFG